ncbi:MAG TPA: hypothetical protein VM935_08070 [Chitinophagaceae bacterium]|nr:hypothetical protein [Chitinophagaceae bacterium]
MALSYISVQQLENTNTTSTAPKQNVGGGELTSLLGAIMLSVYAGQKSRKQLRKLKRQMSWLLVKQKVKSAFSKGAAATDRQILIYVLLGVLIIALVLISPFAALVLAIIGLILILAGVI